MSRYTEMSKDACSTGDVKGAIMYIVVGMKAGDPASLLIGDYLEKEMKDKDKRRTMKDILMSLLEKYNDFDFNSVMITPEDFEKKKDSLGEMLYIRYIYMEINEGRIVLDSSNYLKMKESKYGFERFQRIIDDEIEKAAFQNVINDNNSFLKSIKKSLFGNVSYNKQLLAKVIDGLTKSYNSFYEKMSDDQLKEVQESAGIQHSLGKVVGGGFIFTSE